MEHLKLNFVEIESGDWCKKYKDWISSNTIEKCKRKGTYQEKGCYYCKYRTFMVQRKKKK